MTDSRSDSLLQELFRQSAEQHSETRENLSELKDMVGGLAVTRGEHGAKISILELWRRDDIDPAMARLRDTEAQVKGGAKVAKVAAYGATAALSAGSVAWGPKIVAALAAMFIHSP